MGISISKKKQIQQLAQKKQRDEQGRFVAEGVKLVGDLLAAGLKPVFIVGYAEAIKTIGQRCADVQECTEQEMKAVSSLKTPSPLLAVFEKPKHSENIDTKQLILVLDEIQDPGNMGTIIRVADWFGIKQILCSDNCADAFGPKVVQSTMGAIARVAIRETNLGDLFARNAREWHLPVYGTFLEGENIYTAKLEQRGFVIMGNEGKGISNELKPLITNKLFIPNYPAGSPTSESLNVATATAVVCSEFRRRIFCK
ncbi:MAG: RNA methyltransferase [Bacteroidales bacterium]|nr:RNA methyltransferase [Bacteroidales bacterium]